MSSERRLTLLQLEQAGPYKPACCPSDFAADKSRVLEALEQAGSAGLTTSELMGRASAGAMRSRNEFLPEARLVCWLICRECGKETLAGASSRLCPTCEQRQSRRAFSGAHQ